MSRDPRDPRKGYYNRDWERDRERDRNRDREYRHPIPKRSRSPLRDEKRRSRSPRLKTDKDLDENILSEISKLPEPSELWESNQFPDPGFAPPPPSFQSTEPNPPYTSYPTQSYSGIYDDFPPVAAVPPTPHPPDIASWNQLSLPPPPTAPPQFNVEDQIKKEAAIESEMRHQKAALSKQREDYMKKAGILKKELETLKDQRNELRGDPKRSPSPDTKRFLKENTKLQLEIQNKLKTINNVVDMLNGIIGEEATEAAGDSGDSSPDLKTTKRKSRSPSNKKFNYVYYDPEMHWCRVCNEFPPTAKDYLNHLHSPAHQKMAAAHMEAPWHSVTTANEGFPSFPSAPTKRTPIRGLQFFVPSTAWYCKLCDQFIGDLHCASAHLKSIVHSKNYTNFVEQNPHWETDWMSDRQKAFEKARGNKPKRDDEPKPAQAASRYAAHTITFNKDGFHTKRKDSPPPPAEVKEEKKKKKKEKKKKSKKKKEKSSSSSSSSSDSSSDSDAASKKKKKKLLAHIAEARLNESDRQLLDSLKSRMTRTRDAARDRDSRDASRKREAERSSRSRESPRRGGSRSRSSSRRSSSRAARSPPRKPEIRKMPFIGKMPVYKNLTKTAKTEEQKKEDVKKKEEEEATKKRRDEMDAEIQKKKLPDRIRTLFEERFGDPQAAPTVERLLVLLGEQCRETSREQPREKSREEPRETSREQPREKSREEPRETSREKSHEQLRETSRDQPREVNREQPREKSREQPREPPKPPPAARPAVPPPEPPAALRQAAAASPLPAGPLAAAPHKGPPGTAAARGPIRTGAPNPLNGTAAAKPPLETVAAKAPKGTVEGVPPTRLSVETIAVPPTGPSVQTIPAMPPTGSSFETISAMPSVETMTAMPPMGTQLAMPPMGQPMWPVAPMPYMGPPMGPMAAMQPMGPPMGTMTAMPPMGTMSAMPPSGPPIWPMEPMPPMMQPNQCNPFCPFCQGQDHSLHQCNGFLQLPSSKRRTWARKCDLCYRCLCHHLARECDQSYYCEQCQSPKHNTLLCPAVNTAPTNKFNAFQSKKFTPKAYNKPFMQQVRTNVAQRELGPATDTAAQASQKWEGSPGNGRGPEENPDDFSMLY